jgi:adenosylmethionine-8-amino-7-oxononanoate aminotransferase
MSVGARGVFNQAYAPLLFDVTSIPFPQTGAEDQTLSALEEALRQNAAAFLVEPLILGSGGMRMYSPQILRQMHDLCQRYNVLFIADEVMTGWGRTGTVFACDQASIIPDIGCYGKGLTGGALPLALTLCRHKIFAAHYAPDRERMFFHSSSYSANPIACAAALENIRIWEDEPVHERIAALSSYQKQGIARFQDHPFFSGVRQLGTITALELRGSDSGYLASNTLKLYKFFQSQNILLRPLGNTLYVLPPYCATEEAIQSVYDAIEKAPKACNLF